MLNQELLDNAKQFLKSAELVYSAEDYTSATILYFKAVFSVLDFILLQEEGKAPKDHTERFRMLENNYPDLYLFMDKYFKIYRDIYSVSIDKETCNKVRENVREIIKKYEIQV